MKPIMVSLARALAAISVFNLQIFLVFAQGTAFTTLTITNPAPAVDDLFGYSVATMGSDRVLIGAYLDDTGAFDAGTAYLFSTNAVLLTTFTNPTPYASDSFGHAVAAVGSNRVLIGADGDNTGASRAGAAYLFSTNCTLLTTFTNPTPAPFEGFGRSVAAVGSDRVLIGAPYDSTGASEAGAAYLFSTNGDLITTFTNPAAATSDWFGRSLAALGTDRVLIGAHGDSAGAIGDGTAYLFNTNGGLLTTFTNPTPADGDHFGYSVAAVGSDRVLIGAYGDDSGASDAGAAYLFSTNGSLLTTFTNPTPVANGRFGRSVAAVGSVRVVIGTPNDSTGANYAGAAYLFSTEGAMLTTFTNPTPAAKDYFGDSVAAMGSDRVLIGAYGDDSGASEAGAAYLFSAVQTPAAPTLTIHRTTTNALVVSWPSPSTGWTLHENTNSVLSVNWSNASGTIQDDGTNKTLIVTPPTGSRFYRLFKP